MKVVILAGGLGTRLAEETIVRPKPMVEIGGKPIIWHLMNIYSAQGFNDFVVALGYKGELIKQYFLNLHALSSDLVVDSATGVHSVASPQAPPWRVHLIDTGLQTQTGGRIKRLQSLIGEETFMVTYADGLARIELAKLLEFHKKHGKVATLTAVHPPSRFGKLELVSGKVRSFLEKPATSDGWINGGFYVFEPRIFDYLPGDDTSLERVPMSKLAADGQLMAYEHSDFWQMMDTLPEQMLLDDLWNTNSAPWKIWK